MILIVDDDEGMTETCALLLEAHGFDVSVASSGAQALLQLRAGAHALLITDCAMPGMTGVQLSDTVKTDPAIAHLPILLMSGSLRCEIAPSDNYDAFLRKPFLAEHFVSVVKRLLHPAAAPAAIL